MTRHLAGRVALVTGGASGIGRAIALALAESGAAVAVGTLLNEGDEPVTTVGHYRPSQVELDTVLGVLRTTGSRAFGGHMNVCDEASVATFHEKAKSALGGPVDVLVNVAGIFKSERLAGHRLDIWRATIEINLTGTFLTTRALLGGMIERGWGRIINIASTAASVGNLGSGAYCASKAGVLGLTRCAALEGAPHGVTCNAISPGQVDTPSTRRAFEERKARTGSNQTLEENLAAWRQSNPQGRLIEAEEIGALASYLCTERARGISGQDLTVSGAAIW